MGSHGTLTPSIIAWLRKLEAEGPQQRPARNNIGYRAMKAGFTRWLDHNDSKDWREELTEAGRAALSALEEGGPDGGERG